MNKNKKSTVKLNRYKKRANHSVKRKRTSKIGGGKGGGKLKSVPTRRQVPSSIKKSAIAKTNTAKQAATKKVALAKKAASEQVAAATDAAKKAASEQISKNRITDVQHWNQVREEHGIKNGQSFFSHLPKLIPQSDSSSSEFHLHIPTSNKDLVTEMAHELLSHEIKKNISKSAFGGDEEVQKQHADIIATEILNQKFAQKRINQLSNKMGSLESKVTSQARHDLIGAIPAEVGEVINVALDGIVDTFKSGSTAFSAVKLGKTISEMIETIKKNPAITEELKGQLINYAPHFAPSMVAPSMVPAAATGGKSSRKGRKSRRRGIPLRDARRDARLLRRGGKSCKKITKKK